MLNECLEMLLIVDAWPHDARTEVVGSPFHLVLLSNVGKATEECEKSIVLWVEVVNFDWGNSANNL